jgi:hypothetical protein
VQHGTGEGDEQRDGADDDRQARGAVRLAHGKMLA